MDAIKLIGYLGLFVFGILFRMIYKDSNKQLQQLEEESEKKQNPIMEAFFEQQGQTNKRMNTKVGTLFQCLDDEPQSVHLMTSRGGLGFCFQYDPGLYLFVEEYKIDNGCYMSKLVDPNGREVEIPNLVLYHPEFFVKKDIKQK